ncbi:MAG: S8 family serine peptidase [Pseudobdellovibrionaceae bacterium]
MRYPRSLLFLLTLLLAVTSLAQDYVPGEVIVKMKGKSFQTATQKFLGKAGSSISLKASFPHLGMHKLGLAQGRSVEQTISELRQDPNIEYAEPNYIVRKATIEPDPSILENAGADQREFSREELLQASGSVESLGFSQNLAEVDVEQAWTQLTSLASNGSKAVVAVIDTGVHYNHAAFVATQAIWSNVGEMGLDSMSRDKRSNGIDDDGNGFVDDYRGWNFYSENNNPMDDSRHGTHVAGIIVGVGLDVFGSSLPTSRIQIMPLKFMGADGSGTTSDAIAAINYAVANGAQVINNSWGGSSYSQALHDALKLAYDNNVVLVAAAGNYSLDNDANDMYPANYPVPSQLTVAATNDYDSFASFSNFGRFSVQVAAPGVGILSTVPSMYSSSGTWTFMSGTSMAAPFVAGIAALVVREAPNLSAYQVKNLIMNSGDNVSSVLGRTISERRVNVNNSVVAAKAEVSTAAYAPSYFASNNSRAPASESSAKGGCGTVGPVGSLPSGGGFPPGMAPALILSLLPVLVYFVIRARAKKSNRRQFERFVMKSDMRIRIGDKELVGHMQTISVGGLSFEADTLLEKGGVVTMQIASPDGAEQIQVQGHIVWNEENHKYGVQFDNVREGVADSIRHWTKRLAKSG